MASDEGMCRQLQHHQCAHTWANNANMLYCCCNRKVPQLLYKHLSTTQEHIEGRVYTARECRQVARRAMYLVLCNTMCKAGSKLQHSKSRTRSSPITTVGVAVHEHSYGASMSALMYKAAVLHKTAEEGSKICSHCQVSTLILPFLQLYKSWLRCCQGHITPAVQAPACLIPAGTFTAALEGSQDGIEGCTFAPGDLKPRKSKKHKRCNITQSCRGGMASSSGQSSKPTPCRA